jgi:aspartokinase/homoserine dehydrogenase 1
MADASAITVIKIGGSVLTDAEAYHRAAALLAAQCDAGRTPVVAVVSAAQGHTDDLLEQARAAARAVDPDHDALDLLWSTGEVRSVALLTLALRAAGVSATGLGAHETGLTASGHGAGEAHLRCNPLLIRTALASVSVVVVPGFIATARGRTVTLGRGGSDWSAVRLAASLGAHRCALIKDVDGYFTADPRTTAGARLVAKLSYEDAIQMAADGCPLVQEQALRAGQQAGLELVVRSVNSAGTRVGPGTTLSGGNDGVRNQDDSRRTAERASDRRGRAAHFSNDDLPTDQARRTPGV